MESLIAAALLLLLALLAVPLCAHPGMFTRRRARAHRLTGLLLLSLLLAGFFLLFSSDTPRRWGLLFDCVLSSVGIAVTLSAARDFAHEGVRNEASGTLDPHATVTHSESA